MERDNYKPEVLGQILEIISNLSLPQMEQLLHSLEQWEQPESTDEHESKFFEKRAHFRKDASAFGIFETENEQFRDFTKNVSVAGVLIDSETTLSYHENIFMTLFHKNLNFPVRTNGEVVRVDPDGAGIQFDQVIPVMSSL